MRPSERTRRAASAPRTSAVRPADEPAGGLVELDDAAPGIEHDHRVVHALDDDRPRHGRQVEQPESEQARQERQPGHGECHRGRIDVDVAQELRHVDDVDDPGHDHREEHHDRLGR